MTAGISSELRDNKGPEGSSRQDQPLVLQAYSDENQAACTPPSFP